MKKIDQAVVNNCLNELIPNSTVYLPYMRFLTSYIESIYNCKLEEISTEKLKEYLIEISQLFPFKTTYGKSRGDYIISNVFVENSEEDEKQLISELEIKPVDSSIDDTFLVSLDIAFDNFRIELSIKPIEYDGTISKPSI